MDLKVKNPLNSQGINSYINELYPGFAIYNGLIMDGNNVGYFSRSNEIFDDFIRILAKPEPPAIDKDKVLKDFEDFENTVRQSPEMMQAFAALKKRFAEDPEYKAKVDPKFVAGVMMLDLPSEQK